MSDEPKLPRTLTAFMALMDEDGDIPLGVIDAILRENERLWVAAVTICESCVHWRQTEAPTDWGTWDSDNEPVTAEGTWGVCDKIPHGWGAEDQSVKAFTLDGSNYASSLHTRSDFGCVEHEAPDG